MGLKLSALSEILFILVPRCQHLEQPLILDEEDVGSLFVSVCLLPASLHLCFSLLSHEGDDLLASSAFVETLLAQLNQQLLHD